eukprot:CAMPEP_0177747876 /NCGR_PEP_ID=MMETSP0484_2-20121128/31633_1 /TAXON_ID=354590 /ORGANISM="Rhodomonas lens, Strain RHODO" /LENGTH=95 /DNA_ID=CAMNT_0019262715 /DNA_START=559 /DNA_END=843 /DNA_ORIENTATION=+
MRLFRKLDEQPQRKDDEFMQAPCKHQFRAFFTEFQRARLAGWQGPSSLDLWACTWEADYLDECACQMLAMSLTDLPHLFCLELSCVCLHPQGAFE